MKQKIPYILLGLAILGIILLIFWPRQDLTKKVQQLTTENVILRNQNKTLDSMIQYYRLEVDELDRRLDLASVVIYKDRVVYKDRIKEVPTYLPYQIDSFFKQRYQ